MPGDENLFGQLRLGESGCDPNRNALLGQRQRCRIIPGALAGHVHHYRPVADTQALELVHRSQPRVTEVVFGSL